MASASRRSNERASRLETAFSNLYSDNQSFIAEIRKALMTIKAIAIDLEKAKQLDEVKKLEEAFLDLLVQSDDCTHHLMAIEAVRNKYQPNEELTDFKKMLEDEVEQHKRESPFVPQNDTLFRQFKEAIWNVHHAGQPMPGEEQEDIVVTSTQCNLLNITCPLSGRPVTGLENPVRSVDCKHIYDKAAVTHYIKSKKSSSVQCPVAGCPKMIEQRKVVCDPLLLVEIEELRSQGIQNTRPTFVEDFTEFEGE